MKKSPLLLFALFFSFIFAVPDVARAAEPAPLPSAGAECPHMKKGDKQNCPHADKGAMKGEGGQCPCKQAGSMKDCAKDCPHKAAGDCPCAKGGQAPADCPCQGKGDKSKGEKMGKGKSAEKAEEAK
jgi:hypothetical protein